MKFFIDTNVFYNNWFLENANFKYFLHFINNNYHELIVSKVVVAEVENIRNRELNQAISEITKMSKKVKSLTSLTDLNLASQIKTNDYDLISILNSKVDNLTIIDCDSVTHFEVIQRSMKLIKPFTENEKGYRDTLIWLSFLEHLIKNDIQQDIIFITENKSDFFKPKSPVPTFHPELENDISNKKIKAKIIPFTSLFSFVSSSINKDEHALDYNKCIDKFDSFLENEAELFLEGMSNNNLALLLKDFGISDEEVSNILRVNVEIFEGIEDNDIVSTKALSDDEVYVNFSYNLRIVVLDLTIPESDYQIHKVSIEKKYHNIKFESDTVSISLIVRPYFDVSFIYNKKNDSTKNYEVSSIWIKAK